MSFFILQGDGYFLQTAGENPETRRTGMFSTLRCSAGGYATAKQRPIYSRGMLILL